MVNKMSLRNINIIFGLKVLKLTSNKLVSFVATNLTNARCTPILLKIYNEYAFRNDNAVKKQKSYAVLFLLNYVPCNCSRPHKEEKKIMKIKMSVETVVIDP